jgi:hypothetical protein
MTSPSGWNQIHNSSLSLTSSRSHIPTHPVVTTVRQYTTFFEGTGLIVTGAVHDKCERLASEAPHGTPHPSLYMALLNIHKALPKSLRKGPGPARRGQYDVHHLHFPASVLARTRALPRDTRRGNDDCCSTDAEHLPERAFRRRCKELRHGQHTLSGVNAHARGQQRNRCCGRVIGE